ncbi:hypothetical protein VPH35_030684 [Triticum aestivum]
MPLDFTKHFPVVPAEFKPRNNTGCFWRVTVKLMNGRLTLDQGWATFIAVHQIKIGYMVTFKLLTPDTTTRENPSSSAGLMPTSSAGHRATNKCTLKVIIFDDDGIEVVNKCGKHDEAFAARD